MAPKNIELTREEYNLIAKNRGIQEPQNMSNEELLNTLSRYDSRRKVKNNYIRNKIRNRTRKNC